MGKIVAGIVGGLFLIGLLFGAVQWFSYSNSAVDAEERIDAQVRSNQVEYNRFSQTALDQMKVAKAYTDALSKVIVDGLQGRYAEEGAKPLVLAVSEAYPNVSPEMFQKISQVIESGRTDFAQEQRQLISMVQGYRAELRKPWSKFWYTNAGYPTINLDDPKYNPIISAATKKSFETGVDEGLQF